MPVKLIYIVKKLIEKRNNININNHNNNNFSKQVLNTFGFIFFFLLILHL